MNVWQCNSALYQKAWPDLNVYYEDGAHASAAGSTFVAKYIWEVIWQDQDRKTNKERNV